MPIRLALGTLEGLWLANLERRDFLESETEKRLRKICHDPEITTQVACDFVASDLRYLRILSGILPMLHEPPQMGGGFLI